MTKINAKYIDMTKIDVKYIEENFNIEEEKRLKSVLIACIDFNDFENLNGLTFQEFIGNLNKEIKNIKNKHNRYVRIFEQFCSKFTWCKIECELKIFGERIEADKECIDRLIGVEKRREYLQKNKQKIKKQIKEDIENSSNFNHIKKYY